MSTENEVKPEVEIPKKTRKPREKKAVLAPTPSELTAHIKKKLEWLMLSGTDLRFVPPRSIFSLPTSSYSAPNGEAGIERMGQLIEQFCKWLTSQGVEIISKNEYIVVVPGMKFGPSFFHLFNDAKPHYLPIIGSCFVVNQFYQKYTLSVRIAHIGDTKTAAPVITEYLNGIGAPRHGEVPIYFAGEDDVVRANNMGIFAHELLHFATIPVSNATKLKKTEEKPAETRPDNCHVINCPVHGKRVQAAPPVAPQPVALPPAPAPSTTLVDVDIKSTTKDGIEIKVTGKMTMDELKELLKIAGK